MELTKRLSFAKVFAPFLFVLFIRIDGFSQEFSAGINVDSPNPNAVLHLVSPNGNQGLLIPALTTAQRTAMVLSTTDNGLLVYDQSEGFFYYWLAPSWIRLLVSEGQTLSISGTDLTISSGNTVDLSSAEIDPTVPDAIKDGIDWTELTGIPADIADGDDGGGINTVAVDGTTINGDGNGVPLSVGTVPAGQVSGLATVATTGNFGDLGTIPAGLADGDDVGLTTVATADIIDNNVTLAKLEDGAANQVLVTDGTGNPTYIAQTSLPAGIASDLVAAGAVVNDTEVENNITIDGGTVDNTVIGGGTAAAGTFTALTATGSVTLGADAIQTAEIQDDNVTLAKLENGAANQVLVTDGTGNPTYIAQTSLPGGIATDLVAGTVVVDDAELADNITVSGGLIDNTVIGGGTAAAGTFTALTATGSVTLGADAIQTAEIQDDNVTLAKLENGAANQVLVTDGTGNPTYIAQTSLPGGIATDLVAGTVVVDDAELADNITVIGGSIDNTPIGSGTRNTGAFTTLDANDNVTLGDGPADALTINAEIAGGSPLVFEGPNDNAITTTFSIQDPTGNRTIIFPDQSGTVTLDGSANLQSAYDGGSSIVTSGGNALDISGSEAINLSATSNNVNISTATGGTVLISGADQVDISAGIGGVNIIGDANLTGGSVVIGSALRVSGDVRSANPFVFQGATVDANATTLSIEDPTANRTIIFPNQSGTVTLDANITLQSSYDGGSTIVTSGGQPFGISGPEAINLSATSNNVDISTATGGTVSISGADQVDITAGAGGINLVGNADLNSGTVNVGSDLSVSGDILGGNPLVFQGPSDNANTTTFSIQDPTGNRTIIFPDQSGTVTLDGSANLQSAYDGGNSIVTSGGNPFDVSGPEAINLDATSNDINITTTTNGTVNINGADGLNLTGGPGGINISGNTVFQGSSVTVADATQTDINSATINLGNAAADALTVNAEIAGGSPLVFEGPNDNAITTTFSIQDPTGNRTIIFPDQSGTVTLDGSANLQSAYDGGSSIVTSGGNALDISGSEAINLSATSNNVNISTATGGTVSISGADQVDITAGGGGINLVGNADLNSGTVNVGSDLSVSGDILGGNPLIFQGPSDNANTTTFSIQDPTGNRTIIFPDQSGTVTLDGSANLQSAYDGGSSIVTSGGNALDISGSEAINLSATSNNVNISTATGGTVSILGADQVDITAGGGGINLVGNADLNSGTVNVGSDLSVSGDILGGNPLIFQGPSDNANTTTFSIQDPTGNRTIIFPDQSGTVTLDGSANLQSAYDGGNSIVTSGGNPFDVSGPEAINLDATSNDINITTTTNGTVNINGADGLNLTSGPGGINISGNTVFQGSSVTVADATQTDINSATINLGNAAADALTVNAEIAGGSPLVFEGPNDNAITTTFSIQDPTGNRTIIFPDQSGTVTLDGSANLQSAYDGGSSIVTSGGNALDISGSEAINLSATSNNVSISTATGGTVSISGADQVDITAGGGGINLVGNADLNSGTVNIGSDLSVGGDVLGASPLTFQGLTDDAFTTQLSIINPTANNTINLPNQSGTVLLDGSVSLQTAYDGGQSIVTNASGPFAVSGTNNISLASDSGTSGAISLSTNGGSTETLAITSVQGLGGNAIDIDAQVGGVQIAAATGITLSNSTTLSGGTLTLNDATQVQINSNNISLGNAVTDLIIADGSFFGNNALSFEGSGIDANRTVFNIIEPTVNNTISFPNQSGTVVLDGNVTLQAAYDGGNSIVTSAGQAFDVSGIEAINLSATGNNINLNTLTTGSINLSGVNGVDVNGGTGAINVTTTSNNMNLSTFTTGSINISGIDGVDINAGGTGIDLNGAVNMTGGTVNIASDAFITGDVLSGNPLIFEGATNDAITTTLAIQDPLGVNKTIFLPDQSGTVVLDGNVTLQAAYDGGNSIVTSAGQAFDVSGIEDISLSATGNDINLTTLTSGSITLSGVNGVDVNGGTGAINVTTTSNNMNLSTFTTGSINISGIDGVDINAGGTGIDLNGAVNMTGGTVNIASDAFITGDVLSGNPLIFEGATNDAITTTLAIQDPLAVNKTIFLPDQSGTVVLDGNVTLQAAYDGGNSIVTTAGQAFDVSGIEDINLSATGNDINLTTLTSGSITLSGVNGVDVNGGTGAINVTTTSNNMNLSTFTTGSINISGIDGVDINAGGTGIDLNGAVNMTGGTVNIASDAFITGDVLSGNPLIFEGATNDAITTTLAIQDPLGVNKTIFLPDQSGTVVLDGNVTLQAAYDGGNSIVTSAGQAFDVSGIEAINLSATGNNINLNTLTTGSINLSGVDGVDVNGGTGAINVTTTSNNMNLSTFTTGSINISGIDGVDINAGGTGIDLNGAVNMTGGTVNIASDALITGDVLSGNPLIFEGATNDAITTTLAIQDPLGVNKTIFLPDQSGTVVLDGNVTLQAAYDGGNSIVTSAGQAFDVSGIEAINLSATGNNINLNTLTTGSINLSGVDGVDVNGGTGAINVTTTSNNMNLSTFTTGSINISGIDGVDINAGGTGIDLNGAVNMTGGTVNIASDALITGDVLSGNPLIFEGATNDAITTTLAIQDPLGVNKTIFLPDQSGTVVLDGNVTLQAAYDGGNSIVTSAGQAFDVSGIEAINLSATGNNINLNTLTTGSINLSGVDGVDVNGGTGAINVTTTSNNMNLSTFTTGSINISGIDGVDINAGGTGIDLNGAVNMTGGTVNIASDAFITGDVLSGNPLIFEGATNDAITTTLAIQDPLAVNKTIFLPDQSGTVVLDGNVTLQAAYDGGNSIVTTAGQAFDVSGIEDINLSATGNDINLTTLTSGSITLSGVNGVDVNGGTGAINVTTTSNNMNLSTFTTGSINISGIDGVDINAGGTGIDLNGAVNMTGGTVNIASDALITGDVLSGNPLIFEGATNDAITTTLAIQDPLGVNKTIFLPDQSGTVVLDGNVTLQAAYDGGNSIVTSAGQAFDVSGIEAINLSATGNNINLNTLTTGSINLSGVDGVDVNGGTGAINVTTTSNNMNLSTFTTGSINISGIDGVDINAGGTGIDLNGAVNMTGGTVNITSDAFITGDVLSGNPLIFEGATNDAITTTLAIQDPLGVNKTIFLPDQSGTVVLDGGVTLQAAYDGGNSIVTSAGQAFDVSGIEDINLSATGNDINLSTFTAGSISVSGVDGVNIDGGGSGVALLGDVGISGGTVNLTSATSITGDILGTDALVFQGSTVNVDRTIFSIVEPTATNKISFPDNSGTIVLDSDVTLQNAYFGGNSIVTGGGQAFDVSGIEAINLSATSNDINLTTFTNGSINIDGVDGVNISGGTVTIADGSQLDIASDLISLGDTGTDIILANGSFFGNAALAFEGTAIDGNVTLFDIQEPSTVNVIAFPDNSGTVVLDNDVTLQNAYFGGNSIVTGGGQPFDVSGSELINISATSNDINIVTFTGGTISISGADQVDIDAGTGGVNLVGEINMLGGTVTIENSAQLDISSDFVNLGDVGSDLIAVNGSLLGNTPLVFEGSAVDANATLFDIQEPSTVNVIAFPDQSGTVVLDALISNPGTNNLLVGDLAGLSLSTGADNTFVGANAGNAVNSGSGNVIIGSGANAGSVNVDAVIIGSSASSSQNGAVSLGHNAQVSGLDGIAIGNGAQANANDAVAIGGGTIAPNMNTILLGDGTNSNFNVGIGDPNPQSPLQIGNDLSLFHFDNGLAPPAQIDGEAVADNIYLSGNDILYKEDGFASFIFLEEGNISLMSVNSGLQGNSALGSVFPLLEIDSVGNGQISGALEFGDFNGSASPEDGTIRYNGSELQGRQGGTWQNLIGGIGLPFSNSGSPASEAVNPVFEIENTLQAPAGQFINANNIREPGLVVGNRFTGPGDTGGVLALAAEDDATDLRNVVLIRSDISNSSAISISSDLVFETISSGAMSERMRITDFGIATGAMSIAGSLNLLDIAGDKVVANNVNDLGQIDAVGFAQSIILETSSSRLNFFSFPSLAATTPASPANADTRMTLYQTGLIINGDTPDTNAALDVRSTVSDDTRADVLIFDSGNNAISDASLDFRSDNGPTIADFTLGVDADDSQNFKISESTQLGVNDRLVIQSTTGNVGVNTSNPRGALDVNGSKYVGVRPLAGGQTNTTVEDGDYVIYLNNTANGNMVLPDADNTTIGRQLIFTTSSPSGVMIDAFPGDNIIFDGIVPSVTIINSNPGDTFSVTMVQVDADLWSVTDTAERQ